MANNNNKKSLVKDIAIASCVLGPLLFIIIGGITWMNDGFDGTIMERLFPAMFFGFMAAYGTLLILSNILKEIPKIWFVGAGLVFVATIVCYMLEFTSALTVGAIVLCSILCLLVIIKWISGR